MEIHTLKILRQDRSLIRNLQSFTQMFWSKIIARTFSWEDFLLLGILFCTYKTQTKPFTFYWRFCVVKGNQQVVGAEIADKPGQWNGMIGMLLNYVDYWLSFHIISNTKLNNLFTKRPLILNLKRPMSFKFFDKLSMLMPKIVLFFRYPTTDWSKDDTKNQLAQRTANFTF